MANVLYVSLTGMTEALGKSQVLEYLYGLSKNNNIYLISYEREDDIDELNELQKKIESYNIHWEYMTYTNKYGIFSTLIQLFKGIRIGSKLIKTKNIELMHARSMIPALICAVLKYIYKVKLLFDIRDFSTDEKVDRDRIKKNTLIYVILKKLEIMLYKYSDFIVTLTYISKDILHNKYQIDKNLIDVIPTCANKNIFKRLKNQDNISFKQSLGFNIQDKIIVHSGSVTGWYLFDKEVDVVKKIMDLDKNVKFMILNKGEHKYIKETLKKHNISESRYFIDSVKFEDVNKYLNISDASIYFIKPTFSKKAAAPTKFAELVACSVPSIVNKNIGDMDMYLSDYNVGLMVDIDYVDLNTIHQLIDIMNKITTLNDDYLNIFSMYFDVQVAIEKYDDIYTKLAICI